MNSAASGEPCQGVLIAPDGFSPAALHRARQLGIEAVDATQLHTTLSPDIPPEQADFFTPSPPPATAKPRPARSACASSPAWTSPAHWPCAACLARWCSIHHRRARSCRLRPTGGPAWLRSHLPPRSPAHELLIRGHVSGDFVCQGTVTLEPGSTSHRHRRRSRRERPAKEPSCAANSASSKASAKPSPPSARPGFWRC